MDAGRTEAETEAVKKVNAIPKKRDSANEEIADYSETLVASSWGTAVTIRGGTSDCGVLEEVEDGYYKPKTEQAKIIWTSASKWSVIDIGANIGLATNFLCKNLVVENAICVEPLETNMALTKKNVRRAKVEFVQKCLVSDDSKQKTVKFVQPRSAYEQSRSSMPAFATHKKRRQEIAVPTAKLRDFGAGLNTNNVYLKLDAEGAEEFLPSSLPAFLRKLSNKVVFVLIVGEYSFDNLRSSCKKYRRWLDEVRSAGDGEGWCCFASHTDNPPAGATEHGFERISPRAASRFEFLLGRIVRHREV